MFLALGMAADCYVIVAKVLSSATWGVVSSAATAVACLGLWHVGPSIAKKRQGAGRRERRPAREKTDGKSGVALELAHQRLLAGGELLTNLGQVHIALADPGE